MSKPCGCKECQIINDHNKLVRQLADCTRAMREVSAELAERTSDGTCPTAIHGADLLRWAEKLDAARAGKAAT